MLRKLRLEGTAEAMILTATGGSVKIGDVTKFLQAVFPNGKGSTNPKHGKDVFMAEG